MTFLEAKTQLTWSTTRAQSALKRAYRRARRLRWRIPLLGGPVSFAVFFANAYAIRARFAREHTRTLREFQAATRRGLL